MAESTSAGSKLVLKPREEENETEKEEKSKKRKNKDVEEMKWSPSRLLYNDTPEESESVLPSPLKVKHPPFSKVWSDQDEISILKGMIKFKDERGRDAEQNMTEFRTFILESLVLQATLVQLREKVRRLKEKYQKNVERGNEGRSQHEVELFQLCHKIWTEQHNLSETEQPQHNIPEQHNLLETEPPQQNIPKKVLPVKEKHNIVERGQRNIPEIGRARQLIVDEHHKTIPVTVDEYKIIPVTGLDRQTLDALFNRVSNDIELVLNSKPCLRGSQKEVGIRVLDLCSQSSKLRIKLGELVLQKAISPALRDFPELLEQEVLKAYLEAKLEHAQLLLNAYNSFIKDPTDEAQSAMSAINK